MNKVLKMFLLIWGVAIGFTLTQGDAFEDIFLLERAFLVEVIRDPLASVGTVGFWKYLLMELVLMVLLLVVLGKACKKCFKRRLKKPKRNLVSRKSKQGKAETFVGANRNTNKKVVTSEPSKFKRVVPKK